MKEGIDSQGMHTFWRNYVSNFKKRKNKKGEGVFLLQALVGAHKLIFNYDDGEIGKILSRKCMTIAYKNSKIHFFRRGVLPT
jgi:hypothetical protein